MPFEAQLEKIKETFAQLLSQIQETTLYNLIKEKLDTLPPNLLKLIFLISGGVVLFLFLLFPSLLIIKGIKNQNKTNEIRDTIVQVLDYQKRDNLKALPQAAKGVSSLETEIKSKTSSLKLLDTQIQINRKSNIKSSRVPSFFKQEGIQVLFKELNIKQAIQAQNIMEKLNALLIVENFNLERNSPTEAYYNLNYELVEYSYKPEVKVKKSKKNSKKKSRSKSRTSSKKDGDKKSTK